MKKALSMLLVLSILMSFAAAFPAAASAETSGNFTWDLDEDGILTISGQGKLSASDEYECFKNYRDDVYCLVLESGITGITGLYFSMLSNLSALELPDTFSFSDNEATMENTLGNCRALYDIYVDKNNRELSSINGVLYNKDLTKLLRIPICKDKIDYIPASVIEIGYKASYNCNNLESVLYDGSTEDWNNILINPSNECLKKATIYTLDNMTKDHTYNGFSYTIDSFYNEITITGFDKSATNIEIPSEIDGIPVVEIGDSAFKDCTEITSVTIPSGITWIATEAFSGCNNLTSINIPDSVTSIIMEAFKGCSSLTSINIPNTVTYIDQGVFSNCSSLKSIILPEGITTIHSNTFSMCSKLNNITIPDSVTSIWSGAFEGCSSLKSITIPNGVTSIDGLAFEDCSSLSSINIPNGITSIQYGTFSGCSSLESITIPDSVTSIEGIAFKNCSSLSSINIPNSVTSIQYGAFWGCRRLKSIAIPNSVTSIGAGAFEDCSSLSSINIPDSIISVECGVFENCSNLSNINIPNSITSIQDDAFSGCSSLKNITLPNSVTSIGDSAFENCSSLSNINIPNGITSIQDDAFSGCSSLESINIPDSVISIERDAFDGCSSLKNITLPNSVTSIGNGAFSNCSNLSGINIPDNVKEIGAFAFSKCSSLKSINIPNDITFIQSSTFSGCSNLSDINIPANVKVIGENSFSGCIGLTNIIIPDNVEYIGFMAFEGCSRLAKINIPDSVTYIGDDAFSNCSNLTDVYYGGSEEQWRSIDIHGSGLTGATIHYNCNSSGQETPDESKIYSSSRNMQYTICYFDDFIESGEDDFVITGKTDISYRNHVLGYQNSWFGRLVLVQYSQDMSITSADSNAYLLRVLPLDEKYGTVTALKNYKLTLDGKAYDTKWYEAQYHSPGRDILNKNMHILTYGNTVVDMFDVLYMDWEYRLDSYNSDENTATLVSSYTPYTYRISSLTGLSQHTVRELVGSNVTFTYDKYKRIYSMEKKSEPSLSYYDTIKPSTWDDVEQAANKFINASNEYINGVLSAIQKDDDEQRKQENARRKGAEELKKADDTSKGGAMLAFSTMPDEDRIYAYEALYDMIADIGDDGIDLGKINMTKDIISVSTDIINEITNGVIDHHKTAQYGKYTIEANVSGLIYGSAQANFGNFVCKIGGRTVDSVMVCSTQKQLAEAVSIYCTQLKQLENNAMKAVVDAVVKDLSGKSIADWHKYKIKKVIKKYSSQLSLKGVGDVYETISTCSDTYKQIKSIIKLKNAKPEKQYEAILKIDWLASMKEDKSITDKTVDKLYDKLTSSVESLNAHINSYKDNTHLKKESKFDWLFRIKCPVDIFVYDRSGNEVAHISDYDVDENENVKIEKNGDTKNVYLNNINEYDVKIIAKQDGILNYSIEQFDNGIPIGRANFYDIEMHSGENFHSVNDITDIASEYDRLLLQTEENTLSADEFVSAGNNASVNVYGSGEGGKVLGLGSYAKGDGVTLIAVPDDYHTFTTWYINNEPVSNDMTYSFCAKDDVVVEAVFEEDFCIKGISSSTANDKTYINCRPGNNTKTDFEGFLYISAYDKENRLVHSVRKICSIPANDSISVQAELNSDCANIDKITFLIWDENIQPVFFKTDIDMSDYIDCTDENIVVQSSRNYTDAALVFALYKNDRLVDINVNSVNISSGRNTYALPDYDAADANKLKIMIWRDLPSAFPLYEPYEQFLYNNIA